MISDSKVCELKEKGLHYIKQKNYLSAICCFEEALSQMELTDSLSIVIKNHYAFAMGMEAIATKNMNYFLRSCQLFEEVRFNYNLISFAHGSHLRLNSLDYLIHLSNYGLVIFRRAEFESEQGNENQATKLFAQWEQKRNILNQVFAPLEEAVKILENKYILLEVYEHQLQNAKLLEKFLINKPHSDSKKIAAVNKSIAEIYTKISTWHEKNNDLKMASLYNSKSLSYYKKSASVLETIPSPSQIRKARRTQQPRLFGKRSFPEKLSTPEQSPKTPPSSPR